MEDSQQSKRICAVSFPKTDHLQFTNEYEPENPFYDIDENFVMSHIKGLEEDKRCNWYMSKIFRNESNFNLGLYGPIMIYSKNGEDVDPTKLNQILDSIKNKNKRRD